MEIKDFYPKILIARTKGETSDYKGIEIVGIARWLLNKWEKSEILINQLVICISLFMLILFFIFKRHI